MAKTPKSKKVETLTHDKARRTNVPTAELQSLADQQEELAPRPPKHYPRARPLAKGETRERDPDLDPQIVWNGVKISLTREQAAQLAETGTIEIGDAQLVWRGKDRQDRSDLVVNVPMLYVQEKVHPKAIVDDLKRQTNATRESASDAPDLFADFNGLTDPEARSEFYQHAMHWQNRMILGDSLQVMASLAEREALKGKVQCIYFDPPYGIKFNSNWQVSTLSQDVSDGKLIDITREPEQVKAFRDTWRDGLHSYLTYLRDRLIIARELLSDSGSIFVQISDENVHLVRALLDEVFGKDNFIVTILFVKKGNQKGEAIEAINDYILWFSKRREAAKIRSLFQRSVETEQLDRDFKRVVYDLRDLSLAEFSRQFGSETVLNAKEIVDRFPEAKLYTSSDLTVGGTRANQSLKFTFRGRDRDPGLAKNRCWMHTARPVGNEKYSGLDRLDFADRIIETGGGSIRRRVFLADSGVTKWSNWWDDTGIAGFASEKVYVVQTNSKVIERCLLMGSDPGDLVLDPTCGSGTTATAAEQWGRRWITIDTSRVALALARTRLMSARYPYYYLADSVDGRTKERQITGRIQSEGL
jgi:adenine-specific DNA-methyltransferase